MKYFWIFAVLVLFHLGLEFVFPGLLAVDAHYHIALSKLFIDEGFVREFPHLYFTTLHYDFADQHWLFHVLLMPFASIDSILFFKVLVSVFAAAVYYSWFLIVSRFTSFRFGLLGLVLLGFGSQAFLFRMHLLRAPVVVLIVALIIIFLACDLIRRFNWSSFGLFGLFLFLLAWMYGGFVLIPVLMLLFVFSAFIESIKLKRWELFGRAVGVLLFTLLFLLLGVVLHPYYPEILQYLSVQLFETGPLTNLEVGGEWARLSPHIFFRGHLLASLVFVVASGVFISGCFLYYFLDFGFVSRFSSYQRVVIGGLFLQSLFLLAMTFLSQRFTEYFVPFALLFSVLVFYLFYCDVQVIEWFTQWRNNFLRYVGRRSFRILSVVWLVCSLLFGFIVMIGTLGVYYHSVQVVNADYGYYDVVHVIEGLEEVADPGSIIFNASWDDFPMLFLASQDYYYVWGLDPAFLYSFDADVYYDVRTLWKAKELTSFSTTMKDLLKAEYIFITEDDEKLWNFVSNSEQFELVSASGKVAIFRIVQ